MEKKVDALIKEKKKYALYSNAIAGLSLMATGAATVSIVPAVSVALAIGAGIGAGLATYNLFKAKIDEDQIDRITKDIEQLKEKL